MKAAIGMQEPARLENEELPVLSYRRGSEGVREETMYTAVFRQ
jgi:hypothetical protein